ncbi:MAG: L-serine ammonia-lyase, iron-sulfur-dependent, subunit alpha [Clostridiales Family XIII bacterium]|jgi:L-serine dehydratase|nr:L-serine ammonia-lyase, iron-sulfur-dependent, subunit alpha [Clostridiales Family XIII bacterium]
MEGIMFDYHSIEALVRAAIDQDTKVSRVVLADQVEALGESEKDILARMRTRLAVMRDSVEGGLANHARSFSGLSGGDGARLQVYAGLGADGGSPPGGPLSGGLGARALSYAVAVSEHNAAMGKIVAAPTAGSCGILPAALLSMLDVRGAREEDALLAMVTAGAIGLVIATEASIAGSEGGCQAECGSAAAMAAAALVEMSGGTPEMVADACAIALKNLMGLVCDPVAGLVEAPCVKRNAGGVICAIAAADLALAGVRSVIPVDEVVGAMREVGEAMPAALRETALGGLAATPTGQAVKDRVFGTTS